MLDSKNGIQAIAENDVSYRLQYVRATNNSNSPGLNTQTPGSFNTKGAWLWEAAGLYLSPRMVAGPTADLCPASQYFPTTDRAN